MPSAKADIFNVGDLFQTAYRFEIPSYQREFSWEDKQIDDLFLDFWGAFTQGDSGNAEETEYFLGSIITQKEEEKAVDRVVDGQQRLTTLLILLSVLAEYVSEEEQKELIKCIWISGEGEPQFKINVLNYQQVFRRFMSSIIGIQAGPPPQGKAFELLRNAHWRLTKYVLEVVFNREDATPNDLSEIEKQNIDAFSIWVRKNVFCVVIQDTDPYDDQRLFDKVNSRGLRLSEADRFRSNLIADLNKGSAGAEKASKEWKSNRKRSLLCFESWTSSPSKDDTEAERRLFISWLAGRYLSTERDTDFTKVYKTLKQDPYEFASNHEKDICISIDRKDYRDFYEAIRLDFFKFVIWCAPYFNSLAKPNKEFLGFRHAEIVGLDYLDALIAAAFKPRSKKENVKKIRMVVQFVDLLASRKGWLSRSVNNSVFRQKMVQAIGAVRTTNSEMLAHKLRAIVGDLLVVPQVDAPILNKNNQLWIRHFLGRLNQQTEQLMYNKIKSKYSICGERDNAPEIEHVIAERHSQELDDTFGSALEVKRYRQRLGALVILPRKVNRELGSQPFESKIEKYSVGGILAASFWRNNYTGSGKIKKASPVPFKFQYYDRPTKVMISEREELYKQMLMLFWNQDSIK